MKKLFLFIIVSLTMILSNCSDITSPVSGPDAESAGESTPVFSEETTTLSSESDLWVGAYLASWNHYVPPTGNWGNLPTNAIDWDAFTHVFYFARGVNEDGSLSEIAPYQNMSPERIISAVEAAHNAGKPILFTVGGWGNYNGFSNAIKPANRAVFIANIITTITQWGFDGVDIDMEPVKDSDTDNYIAFINELNTALSVINVPLSPKPLVTVVTNWHPELFGQIHDKVDQVNLMTYDLSGAWSGWVTWHNSAVESGGITFPGSSKPVPSIDEKVKAFMAAGVPASKLGIGIDFYGYVWRGGSGTSTGGATEPNQSWDTPPSVEDNVPYHKIMDDYYQEANYRWDNQAKAAYLSFDKPGSADDMFISYDDERSIIAKFDYAREKGLGGTIIWELSGGYRKNMPAGQRDILLQTVKEAMNGVSSSQQQPAGDTHAPQVQVTAPGNGAEVSGVVNITVNATDNAGISSVELMVDGISVESFTTAPYSYTWNTSGLTDGNYTIEAVAWDEAGNNAASKITVEVNNVPDAATPAPSPGQGAPVYTDNLNDPWINASWSATVDLNNSETAKSGSKAIKVDQKRWGALSLHSGTWGNGINVNSSDFEAVEFALYSAGPANFNIRLQNDDGQTFPQISHNVTNTGQWTIVRIPINELNPKNLNVHRLSIAETSGADVTYFVDDITFVEHNAASNVSALKQSIFEEELASPWINASWSASVGMGASNAHNGASAIKVTQKKWGAFSIHSGSWGQTQDVDPSGYEAVEFAVFAQGKPMKLNLKLQNDSGISFPSVSYTAIPAGQWTIIRIPMSELNPNNQIFHRISIMETSGSTMTYFVDDYALVKKPAL